MTSTMVRTHVVLSQDLLDEIDRLVGSRRRSEFIAEALEEKLARARLVAAATKAAGSLADADIPGWESSEAAAQWVWSLRAMDARRLDRMQERS